MCTELEKDWVYAFWKKYNDAKILTAFDAPTIQKMRMNASHSKPIKTKL